MAIVSHKEFKAFFETFFIPVYTLMQRYTGERELSRDFTQEAFVRVFEHRGEFETEENAKAFLYTVARRIYLDHCKHQKIENQYQNRVPNSEISAFISAKALAFSVGFLSKSRATCPVIRKYNSEIIAIKGTSHNTVRYHKPRISTSSFPPS